MNKRLTVLVTGALATAALWTAAVAAASGAGGAESAGAAAAADPIVAAAGDIACDPKNARFNGGAGTASRCAQRATSRLLDATRLAAVLPLGDNQYYCGSYAAFLGSYDLSWGKVKSISRPAAGNHEYSTAGAADRTACDSTNKGAAGYFRYFGSSAGDPKKGYYSYDLAEWHVVVLNSNCNRVGGCGATSPQGAWLKADLAAHPTTCTLAYWHAPLFSSGDLESTDTRPFWDLLYAAKADVILGGHDHLYERFAPQTPSGVVDRARGIREFVVGTGGANHTKLTATAPNSEVRNSTTFGVLELTLHATSYDWTFVPVAGQTFTDAGTGSCQA